MLEGFVAALNKLFFAGRGVEVEAAILIMQVQRSERESGVLTHFSTIQI